MESEEQKIHKIGYNSAFTTWQNRNAECCKKDYFVEDPVKGQGTRWKCRLIFCHFAMHTEGEQRNIQWLLAGSQQGPVGILGCVCARVHTLHLLFWHMLANFNRDLLISS